VLAPSRTGRPALNNKVRLFSLVEPLAMLGAQCAEARLKQNASPRPTDKVLAHQLDIGTGLAEINPRADAVPKRLYAAHPCGASGGCPNMYVDAVLGRISHF
jgi:hypothetical protein